MVTEKRLLKTERESLTLVDLKKWETTITMDFLEALASDCSLNLSMPLFDELKLLPEKQLRGMFADIHTECKQDEADIHMTEVWKHHPGYMKANNFLRLYTPPVLLFFGTFGNVISVIILAKSMFRVGTYSYLTVLSVMDLFVLYVGLLRIWIGNYTLDIQHHSDILCKLVNLVGYVCSDMSVWLIVAVTVERFLVVNLPLKAPRMCNARRARWIILALFVSICTLNIHFLWTVKVNTNSQQCDAGPSYEFLVKRVWTWVDACVYSMFPFLIISMLNVLIIRRIMFAKRKRTRLQMHPLILMSRRNVPMKITPKPNENGRSLTCMLLVISFSFVLTTLPMAVFTIVNAIRGPGTGSESREAELYKFATFQVAKTVVELLMYLNHSINFFLYCAMGEKFRQQLWLMVARCLRRKPEHLFANLHSTHSTFSSSTKMSRLQSTRRSTFIDMRE